MNDKTFGKHPTGVSTPSQAADPAGCLSGSLSDTESLLQQRLPLGKSFDLTARRLKICDREALWVGFNGFCDASLLEKVYAAVEDLTDQSCTEQTLQDCLGFVEIDFYETLEELITPLLCGNSLLFVDGLTKGAVLDTRQYPSRGIEEPELEKITRGARDGFNEHLLTNANLIRRRIRSSELIFEMHRVGKIGATDIAITYLQDRCDLSLVEKLRAQLEEMKVTALTCGSRSLSELLVPHHWWNPLPSIQVTERPDVAAGYLTEGYVLLLVDNTPMTLILPGSIFQFIQTAEDYYKAPIVGSYLRLVRLLCMPVAMFLLPLFLLFTAYFPELSRKWQLITTDYPGKGHLIFYVLSVEFFLALFQYSASLTSEKFSGSLSIVGGLLIGDMAIRLNWSSTEVLFYGAITLLATLSVSCVELSDALRIYRIFLILGIALGGPAGFMICLFLVFLSVVTTPSFGGYSYFWPLIPWNFSALKYLLFRKPTPEAQPSNVWPRSKAQRDKGTS